MAGGGAQAAAIAETQRCSPPKMATLRRLKSLEQRSGSAKSAPVDRVVDAHREVAEVGAASDGSTGDE